MKGPAKAPSLYRHLSATPYT